MEIVNSKEYKSQVHKKDIMQIDLVLSKIFEYSTLQDLKSFNIVCKKWNQLSNPFVYRKINLLSNIKAEEFINTSAKYAHYIEELAYCQSLKPQRDIRFFESLNSLTKLDIYNVKINQDQFLCLVKPLNKLEDLKLGSTTIKEIKRKRLCTEPVQLPHTLIKLSIINLKLVGNPALFVETMSSHRCLKEFIVNSSDASNFMSLFCTGYPSLKFFQYINCKPKNLQPLINVFESNPQINTLKLDSSLLGALAAHLRLYLTNLKELELCSSIDFVPDSTYMFSQHIKVKKLKLTVKVLTSALLNCLLQNCPKLEELIYEPGGLFSLKSISVRVENPTKIKKLRISKASFDDTSFESIVINCPYLEELDVSFTSEWKGQYETISQRCANLKSLTLYSSVENNSHTEYTTLEFLSGNCSFKNILTSLTLENFPFNAINSAHLQGYSNLKSIKFQSCHNQYEKNIDEVLNNNDSWPNYLKIPIGGSYLYGKAFKKYII
jgi:hypothetical protein